jgi:hypothetical protein
MLPGCGIWLSVVILRVGIRGRFLRPDFVQVMTMNDIWSWVLALSGLLQLWLVGRMVRAGWLVGMFTSFLWAVYAVTFSAWGFIVSAVVFGWVHWSNWRKWGS